MSDHTALTPAVEQATSGLANISIDPDVSGNDTDSTGSVPDLVPASDSDNDADESGSDVHMHPATPVIRTDTRAVNGNTNPTLNIDSPVRGGSFLSPAHVGLSQMYVNKTSLKPGLSRLSEE
ncbi:hypothetical protein B0H11DRAFT_1932989 [Mycena galericulata]|nr:hypothetical protein B0H11DRAFT_1932989 [Mycena galericulata]